MFSFIRLLPIAGSTNRFLGLTIKGYDHPTKSRLQTVHQAETGFVIPSGQGKTRKISLRRFFLFWKKDRVNMVFSYSI